MKISREGLDLIKKFEGCRLTSYKDAVGVWTIGYGHTKGVHQGQKITQSQADNFLAADCTNAEKAVAFYDGVYHWTQAEFDALVSFAFNLGNASIRQVTANGTRTKKQISEKILAYNKAGGRVLAGLEARRQAEKKLFDSTGTKQTKKKKEEVQDMPLVKFGSEGMAVKIWQIIVGTETDGKFGGKTKDATKTWQEKHGLMPDGVVGELTWTAAIKEL